MFQVDLSTLHKMQIGRLWLMTTSVKIPSSNSLQISKYSYQSGSRPESNEDKAVDGEDER